MRLGRREGEMQGRSGPCTRARQLATLPYLSEPGTRRLPELPRCRFQRSDPWRHKSSSLVHGRLWVKGEGGRERGREGERKRGREREREGERQGRESGREGERERGREGGGKRSEVQEADRMHTGKQEERRGEAGWGVKRREREVWEMGNERHSKDGAGFPMTSVSIG